MTTADAAMILAATLTNFSWLFSLKTLWFGDDK